jgi:hypothetical protein
MVLYMIPLLESNRLLLTLHSLAATLSSFIRMRPKEIQTTALSDMRRCFEFLDFLTQSSVAAPYQQSRAGSADCIFAQQPAPRRATATI